MKYAQRMKDLREDNDYTQQDIADILNIDRSYYGKYERGIHPTPTDIIIKLCRLYGVSADYILGLTDIPKPLPKK